MTNLRVLHIIQCLNSGGAERHVLALLPHLQTAGMSASVLTIYPSGLPADVRAALPFPVIDISRGGRGDFTAFARLVRALRRLKPDIVHTHTHSGKYWGRLAALVAGVKTIVHTEHSPCDPRRSVFERLVNPVLARITSAVVTFLPEQGRVLAHTDHIPHEKISIIPNGLCQRPEPTAAQRRFARQALALDPNDFAVFVVGRLEFPKNQELAIAAVAALDPEVRDRVRLLIAGDGSRDTHLRDLVRDLNVPQSVRFLGHRSDIESLIPAGDLAALTSLYEGMPIAFIEAMLAHVPVLSTPWPGAASMLGNGRFGFITPGWEPGQVATEIARAYRNAGTRTAMAVRAYAHACEEYDIGRVAQAHCRLYLQAHDKGNRS